MPAFFKYEGTANDFVLVVLEEGGREGRDERIDDATVQAICDRHRGIGADGILFVLPPSSPSGGGDARMVIRNADGSRPEMCGNGVRCVAVHLASLRGESGVVALETDAGIKRCVVELSGKGAGQVAVGMGAVVLGAREELPYEKGTITVRRVDAGNPHAVTFDAIDDASFDALGASLQKGERFPNGVNLERARVERPGVLRVDVFERGVGRTMACGTGACAVAAAARVDLALGERTALDVVLPGGTLLIGVADDGETIMRGPARRVFSGSW